MEIRLVWKNLKQSDALEDYFRHKVEHLEHYIKPILSADLELGHDKHHKKGRVYYAEARLAVAKKAIYASETADHAYEAIDLLLRRLSSRINDYHEKNIKHSRGRNLKEKNTVERRFARGSKRPPR